MSERGDWAVRLPKSALSAAGAVRLQAGIQACQVERDVWLRGSELTEELSAELRKLALDGIYQVDSDGTLSRPGTLLPHGSLPEAAWLPIAEFLPVAPQPAAPGGQVSGTIALGIERSPEERPASLIITTIESWAEYARSAPAVRLSRLTIAACADGRVVVRGVPLPPVRGMPFTLNEGIAVPCGFHLTPAVQPSVVRVLLKIEEGDLALFNTHGGYETIRSHSFARATRGGAQRTHAELRP